jgi:murein DD-endopeptidase MepM/ murein hydrolase activator NlpD
MYNKILVIGLIAVLVTLNSPLVSAQEATTSEVPATETTSEPDNKPTEPATTEVKPVDEIEASKKFEEIKNTINNTKSTLNKAITDTSLLENRLEETTELVTTLEEQLANIDSRYEKTEQRIVLITFNIQKNEEELEALLDEISILVRQIEDQKDKLKNLLQLIFFQSEQVGFFDPEDLQTIKLLLADDSVSEMLDKAESLSMLEYAMSDLIRDLEGNLSDLEDDKQKVEDATDELKTLKENLSKEQVFLGLQKSAKESLLETTKGEESLYRELLNRAKEEQIQIRTEFVDLLKLYAEFQDVLGKNGFATDDFGVGGVLSWPIPPSLGVSAYFRDPTYRKAIGVEHNAVDIRAPQATTVTSAADGIVLKVKGGEGLDYHYIVIGHNDEVMTLYGHMYDIFVQVGQSVKRGDPIGLSGGLPGSRGAGWLTTGPHLHFEVFKNGKHTDPIDFLDVTALPKRFQR